MKPHECPTEARIIEAVRSGRWTPELQEHTAHCEACADAALAARVLNQMRAIDGVDARIPDAGLMWWKAQLLAKREAAERATQPINFVERFAYAWAAVCTIGICIWQWPSIHAWLVSIANSPARLNLGSLRNAVSHGWLNAISSLPQKSTHVQGPGLVMIISIGILLIFVAFAAYFTLSEE